MISNLTKIGASLSIGYLVVYCFVVWSLVDLSKAPTISEFGDALAGAFAPLAFLWLVVGYFLQAKELRNSVDALKLQSEELSNSVEQYRQMVAVDRERLNFDRENAELAEINRRDQLKPIFRIRAGSSSKSGHLRTFKFSLVNIGNDCHEVRGHLVLDGVLSEPAFQQIDHFPKEASVPWTIQLDRQIFKTGRLELTYQDVTGEIHETEFAIDGSGNLEQFNVNVARAPMKDLGQTKGEITF